MRWWKSRAWRRWADEESGARRPATRTATILGATRRTAKGTLKQILQNLRSGVIELAEVPCPLVRRGHLLIQTTRSLVSPGTERSLVEFAQAGLIGKARAQPEKVRQVLEKIRTDGLLPTLETVFSRLDEPLPLGYCSVGRVIEVGEGVQGFRVGDRVASNGPHAEIVHVPATLAARVPDAVDDESAAFTVLGAIALHAVRLAEPTFGESFAVVGLGLVGLLTAQFLQAHGCHVIGIDPNAARCALASSLGCGAVCGGGSDPVGAARALSGGRGVDGVLITASAPTDEIIHQAAQMSRKRGRIVLVGVVGLDLRRSDFYEKELRFQVSCSYGPGRHDPSYESGGRDYPLPYVRWTVARNFEAVLQGMAGGKVSVLPLVSHRVHQAEAAQAYRGVLDDPQALGIVLDYPDAELPRTRTLELHTATPTTSPPCQPVVGLIGSGHFARRVLLPALKACGADVRSIASAGGVSGLHAAKKFDAEQTTTDYREVLSDSKINVVFIATRHDDHSRIAAEALQAGKHVFVEKPLAIDEEGLARVREAHSLRSDLQLMVGFNRRFAPHAVKVREALSGRANPLSMRILVNAGVLPPEHWTHDPSIGGGRILGEACHFVDLAMFLAGSPIRTVEAASLGAPDGSVSVQLTFTDGSIAAIDYWCNGPQSFPKERVEVFSDGRAVVIDNWRRLDSYDWAGMPTMRLRQNKGHDAEIGAFLQRVREGGAPLIPFAELDLVTRATLAVVQSLTRQCCLSVDPDPNDSPGTATASAQLIRT